MEGTHKQANFLLRIVELLCALVSFSAAVYWNSVFLVSYTWLGFFIFIGVSSFIFDIYFMASYVFFNHIQYTVLAALKEFEIIVTCLWAMMWLIASSIVASNVDTSASLPHLMAKSEVYVAIVAGFMSTLVWCFSAFICWRRDLLRGGYNR